MNAPSLVGAWFRINFVHCSAMARVDALLPQGTLGRLPPSRTVWEARWRRIQTVTTSSKVVYFCMVDPTRRIISSLVNESVSRSATIRSNGVRWRRTFAGAANVCWRRERPVVEMRALDLARLFPPCNGAVFLVGRLGCDSLAVALAIKCTATFELFSTDSARSI